MPTPRNPSLTLSQLRLDTVIDKLTEGKNCKYPPTVEDVWATGLINVGEGPVRDYVAARWSLTPAGCTMRARKLIGRMEKYRREAEGHPSAVWKVTGGWYSDNSCYVAGKMSPTLKEGTWLLWGWLFTDKARGGSDLRFAIVGLGGSREALTRNGALISRMEERVESARARTAEAIKIQEEAERLLESVKDMNASMTAAVAEELLAR